MRLVDLPLRRQDLWSRRLGQLLMRLVDFRMTRRALRPRMLKTLPIGGRESSVAEEAVVGEAIYLWAKEDEGE